jgi:hypothetical protein
LAQHCGWRTDQTLHLQTFVQTHHLLAASKPAQTEAF